MPLTKLPTDAPIAVVFGNEHDGIDDAWREQIDLPFTIPMVGLVESLNISVAAAVTLHQLTLMFQASWSQEDYYLSHADQLALLSNWSTKTLRNWPRELERLQAANQIEPY